MATKITRAVTRETNDVDASFGEILMVRLDEGGKTISIWQKGRRDRFVLRYADIFRLGANNRAAAGARHTNLVPQRGKL